MGDSEKIWEIGAMGTSVICQNFETIDMNGVEINERVFVMYLEKRSEVVLDHIKNKPTIVVTPKVKVSLSLKTKIGVRVQSFCSNYTYTPSGNEKQCHVGGVSINSK